MDQEYKQLIQTLRYRRMEIGLTQEALARKLKVSQQLISKIEHGKQPPNLRFFLKICNVLGLTVGVSASG